MQRTSLECEDSDSYHVIKLPERWLTLNNLARADYTCVTFWLERHVAPARNAHHREVHTDSVPSAGHNTC